MGSVDTTARAADQQQRTRPWSHRGTQRVGPPLSRVRQTGLTLLELLVAMLIAALILGFGTPSFGEFRRNARLAGVANDLLATVQLARTESIKRDVVVSVCASRTVDAGQPQCAGDAEFSQWIAFVDEDGDCQRAADETILQAVRVIDADEASRLSATANGTCISFAPNGFLRSDGAFATASTVLICDERGLGRIDGRGDAQARGVEVLPSGRAAVTRNAGRLQAWMDGGLSCPSAP